MTAERQPNKLLNDLSVAGRRGLSLPALDVPPAEPPPSGQLRRELRLPQATQQEVVRYFTRLSQRNYSIDTNFYPLGSCTMKYNPRINEQLALLPGLANLHPNQDGRNAQGALQLMHDLQRMLCEITGFSHCSLAPLAGAHGEYAGISMVRSYLADNGQGGRTTALIPDAAHGTNPASAYMAGMEVKTVRSDASGHVDVAHLKELADETTAVFMLTLPNTLGLFEPNILEITKTIHDCGGMVYADGANLNALIGLARFADLGFDVCHSNLHKTFSTPHGGGGPGAGPVMVVERLADYLPTPTVMRDGDGDNATYRLAAPPRTIGRMGGFHGSFGILVRAYVYIMTFGREWLGQMSEDAVLNANYIQSQLKDLFECASKNQHCMHETVMQATPQAKKGVKALDIAKRLLDYGIHSPTMYFPLIAPEALMIEPTECETRDTLDRFIAVMRQINAEIESDPDLVRNAPHNLDAKRMDEAAAARNPILNWAASKR